MQLLVIAWINSIFAGELLSHQKITERLKNISRDFGQKRHKSFEDNRNNELVFLQHQNNDTIYKSIKKSLEAYLSATPNAGVYVVSVKPATYRQNFAQIDSLLVTAAQIIERCKKNSTTLKFERFNFKWDCWKISKASDYAKLYESYKSFDLVYIDGCVQGYNSYDDYVKFYADSKVIEYFTLPVTIISLQKKHLETQFIAINGMSDNLSWFNFTTAPIVLIKLRNHTPGPYTGRRNVQEIIFADVVKIKYSYCVKNIRHTQMEWNNLTNFYRFGKNIIYIDSAEKTPPKPESRIKKEYPGLQYKKIIKQESLELIKKVNSKQEIVFTSFLIENQVGFAKSSTDDENYKYEVLVMGKISFYGYNLHAYAIKYPVKDVDGKDPIENFDQNSIYYQRMLEYHTKMSAILDKLHKIILNDCEYGCNQEMELEKILKIRSLRFYDSNKWVLPVKFDHNVDTYHAKNNEFIANLQIAFGANVSYKLFDAYFHHNKIIAYYNQDVSTRLLEYYVINKEISLDEYKNYTSDNYSDIVIYITIKEKNETKVCYTFFQERNYKYASCLARQFCNFNYYKKVENFLKNTVEKLGENVYFYNKLGFANPKAIPVVDPIKDHLKDIGFAMLDVIKHDIIEFFFFNNNFCQKAIFFAKEKLVKTKDTKFAIQGFTKIPVYNCTKNERLEVTQNDVGITEETTHKSSNLEFIKEEIMNIVNLDFFIDVILEPNDALMHKAPCRFYMEVLKHIHNEFLENYLGYNMYCKIKNRIARLNQSNVTEDEETYVKMLETLVKTFQKQ